MIVVKIKSEQKVSLERRDGAGSPWEFVCASPCGVATPTASQYRIIGDDVNESHPFVLDTSSGGDTVTLDVTPGSHNKERTGRILLIGGAAFVIGGVITLLAGSKSSTAPGDDGTATNNQNTDFISVGSAVIVAGVLLGLGGGALMYDNAHTKVEGSVGDVPERSGSGDAKPAASKRAHAAATPTWHEDRGPALAPGQFVSLFQRSF
jgi:hypothetical protein